MLDLGALVANRFRLLADAGRGGTAQVFRAFDSESQCTVALKLFDGHVLSDAIKAEICNREARALERLNHPCIAKLVAVGRCSSFGIRYIATEWIEGKTLEEFLKSIGLISWQRFLGEIGTDLLSALCHAFEQDVLHRDVSLRNILVAPVGQIKIIDFGQAKLSAVGIGVTVAGWKTPPYSPPEEDTGRYTSTRDPYSFAALVVRACSGREIRNHDELYDALAVVGVDADIRKVLEKALHRDPKLRYESIVELRDTLAERLEEVESDFPLAVGIRFLPNAFHWLEDRATEEIHTVQEDILIQLNDAVAVRVVPETTERAPNRLQFETSSYRLIVDIDATHRDHLVVIGASIKRFSLEGLYKDDAWIATASFCHTPARANNRELARQAVTAFYQRFEQALGHERITTGPRGDDFLAEWARVLDAMREVESARIPPLRYRLVGVEGRRLIVDLENPRDAKEDQIRTISRAGSANWVFKGEIEKVEGRRCTLYSRAFSVDPLDIPSDGVLDHDWSQTRKALDRQAVAIERFRNRETPSQSVRQLLLGLSVGRPEPVFGTVSKFFDQKLNEEKKTAVSQFLGTDDLLLIHGPPGTGKTKLIVEIIRQELAQNPTAKILLVSQTHVALDHALGEVVNLQDPGLAVRIVSGTKPLASAVMHCSVEARGQQLQATVERASKNYLLTQATNAGVDYAELTLGIRASEVLHLRSLVQASESKSRVLEGEIEALHAEQQQASGTTMQRDEQRARLRALSEDLDELRDDLAFTKSQLSMATKDLQDVNSDGKQLAALDDKELEDWCRLLLDGPERERLRELFKIAEDWRLKFATSDDFKAAIVASSRIVAGTCVGFCREAAASDAQYDLCIIDEASKATTTELLLPLSRCKKAVLVGDHHQLPPFVEYALKSETLKQKHNLSSDILEAQLFEELQKSLAEGQKAKLRYQYRMRGSIGRLISECFYRGELELGLDSEDAEEFSDLGLAGLSSRVVWLDAPGQGGGIQAEQRAGGTSWVNMIEVRCVVNLLTKIAFLIGNQEKKLKRPTIGVISGYAQQVEALNREIGRLPELKALDIECNSVHTFQGREVDICIYSITRNNHVGDIGFLGDWRHLNVALSRAKWNLVIVGSTAFCASVNGENPFERVLNFISSENDCAIRLYSDG